MAEQVPSDEMALAARGISTRRPSNELERQLAIVVCRLNRYHHPLDNTPLSEEEMESKATWSTYSKLVPHEVFLWMWNLGRDQWDTP